MRHLIILEFDVGDVLILAHDLAEFLTIIGLESLHLGTMCLPLLVVGLLLTMVLVSYYLRFLTWLWVSGHHAFLCLLWVCSLLMMLLAHLSMVLGSLRMASSHLLLLALLQSLDLLNLLWR